MDEQTQPFHYTYSAKQQEEIRRIREKYIAKEENKMEQLRRLDESATKTATVAALALGIISALVMGVGMCCTMVWADKWFVPGIIVGCIGLAGVIAAYPLYNRIAKKHREKIAPEILRLTEELSKQ
jgi:F0F1-type ATP synthase assembly protein I